MLAVHEITKRYGPKTAIDGVSFQVEQGEVVGFLGVNGAGKSTTMNIITGYLSTTEGRVTVDGFDILTQPAKAKEQIGYLPEIPPVYPELTVWENLKFAYSLRRPRGLDQNRHLDELCDLLQIGQVKSRLIQNLSKGYRQRVGLAAALIGNPPLLILDEPTVGLDPRQIIEIRNLIKELAKTRTVLLSSHILQEIQAVCGRIIIIDQGHIVADDTPENLIAARMAERRVILQAQGDSDQVYALLQSLEHVEEITRVPGAEGSPPHFFLKTDEADVRPVLSLLLADHRIPLLELQYKTPTLEDVFLSLTQQHPGAEPAEAEALPAGADHFPLEGAESNAGDL